ncbi:MAG TPA: MFS transporter [Armatimonadota bacterium]|nr:MFS transporter [Armatimonadota bacterium]
MVERRHRGGLGRQLLLLVVAACCMAAAMKIFDATFNNFINDTFHLSAEQRGRLEFPRELPGFLVAVFAGVFFFMNEVRLAALALAVLAVGNIGIGLVGRDYWTMIAFMFLYSAGMHLFGPLRGAIVLAASQPHERGTRLGQVGGMQVAAGIAGAAVVWLGWKHLHMSYTTLFVVSGGLALAGALVMLGMRPVERHPGARPKLVVKRKYALFYLLSVLFGARKQIFITFGPWVLIKVFGQSPSTFGLLSVIASVIGSWMLPQLGRWIDRLGERAILMAEAALLVWVCISYGYAERFAGAWALYVVCATLVLDELLFAVGMARTTYMDKIAETKADLTASLSLSVSIDHAVSMTVPALGGWLWVRYGYPVVFLAGAVIALANLAAASRVRVARSTDLRGGEAPSAT